MRPENVKLQSDTILSALRTQSTDILYLHAPDINTPIEDTLSAVQELYEMKRFTALGLSNYAAWEVAYIWGYCSSRGWVVPTVYQGMYNAITRDVERELFPALKKLNMKFYAYNPLCGGFLTGKHSKEEDSKSEGTRFDKSNQLYRGRYWKDSYFSAVDIIAKACESSGLAMADASLRWMQHHSGLSGDRGDGVIIGASSTHHLLSNLDSCEGGPLPPEVVQAFDDAWELTRPVCDKYFRP